MRLGACFAALAFAACPSSPPAPTPEPAPAPGPALPPHALVRLGEPEVIATPQTVDRVVFTPDGRTLITSGFGPYGILLFDLETGALKDTHLADQELRGIGLALAPGRPERAAMCTLNDVVVYDFTARAVLHRITRDASGSWCKIAWHADGKRFIVATNDVVRVIDGDAGTVIAEIKNAAEQIVDDHTGEMVDAEVQPFHVAATADGFVAFAHESKVVFDGQALVRKPPAMDDRRVAALSPDGLRLVAMSRDQLDIVSLDQQDPARVSLPAPSGFTPQGFASFSPDGQTVMIGFTRRSQMRTQLVDARTGALIADLPGFDVRVVGWSPDGQRIAIGGVRSVQVIDRSGKRAFGRPGVTGHNVRELFANRDGTRLAVHDKRGLRIWDVTRGEVIGELFAGEGLVAAYAEVDFEGGRWALLERAQETQPENWLRFGPLPFGSEQRVALGAASPSLLALGDGGQIVVRLDRQLRVFDARGTPLTTPPAVDLNFGAPAWFPAHEHLLAKTPDGTTTASMLHVSWLALRRQSDPLGRAIDHHFPGDHKPCALTSDGQRFIAAGRRGVEVYDVVSGVSLGRRADGIGSELSTLTLSGDGERLFTGMVDGTTTAWDLTLAAPPAITPPGLEPLGAHERELFTEGTKLELRVNGTGPMSYEEAEAQGDPGLEGDPHTVVGGLASCEVQSPVRRGDRLTARLLCEGTFADLLRGGLVSDVRGTLFVDEQDAEVERAKDAPLFAPRVLPAAGPKCVEHASSQGGGETRRVTRCFDERGVTRIEVEEVDGDEVRTKVVFTRRR